MEKLSYKKIEKIFDQLLEEDLLCTSSLFEGEFMGDFDSVDDDELEKVEKKVDTLISKLGSAEWVVDGDMDEEGQYYSVVYFKDHDIFVKFYGWYSSHEGAELEGYYQTKPTQKTITVYNEIK